MVYTDAELGSMTNGAGVVVSPVDTDHQSRVGHDDQASPPPPPPSSSSSTSGNASAAAKITMGAECRICLSSEQPESFVQPCTCDGSLRYAHLHCLKSWVHERQRLSCEICKAMYAEALLPELKEEMRDPDHAASHRGYTVDGNQSPRVFILPGMAHTGSTTRRRNNNKSLMNILIIAFVIIVIVVILVVLGLNASQHTWAAILLRIVAFGLPLLIIGRAFIICCEMRRTPGTPQQETDDSRNATTTH